MQTGMMRLRELTVRYAVRKDHEGQPIVVGRNLGSPTETASALMTALQDQPGEVFAILCVSTKLRVIAYHEVSRGTLDGTLVHPREVFGAAATAGAAALVSVAAGVLAAGLDGVEFIIANTDLQALRLKPEAGHVEHQLVFIKQTKHDLFTKQCRQ